MQLITPNSPPPVAARMPLLGADGRALDPVRVARGLVPGTGPKIALTMNREVGSRTEKDHLAADMATAKWVGELLHSHYRGHFWMVHVDSKQGVCMITIPILLGNWKWTIYLKNLTPWVVIRAGGEILERFNVPRSALDVAAFVEARKKSVSRASQKPPGGL